MYTHLNNSLRSVLKEKSMSYLLLAIKNIVRKGLPGSTSRYRRFMFRVAHFPSLSYSFAGEDILISLLIAGESRKIRWVDIGCAHPIFDNNTYRFYGKGGSGVNVDARKSLKLAHRVFRPRDRFVNAIVSDRVSNQPVEFFVNPDDPHMSSISSNWAKGHLNSTHELKSVFVGQVTLAQLFRLNSDFLNIQTTELRNETLLILSIDTEGHDLSVLRSNDWNAYSPDIICVETIETKSISDLEANEIFKFLESKNYVLASFSLLTSIFIPKSAAKSHTTRI